MPALQKGDALRLQRMPRSRLRKVNADVHGTTLHYRRLAGRCGPHLLRADALQLSERNSRSREEAA